MVYTGVKCDNFRCDKLSDKVIAELIVAAVPFFVAVFIARQILRNCEWRWSRIKNFVEDLDMDPLNNWLAILCLRPFYTYLLKILVIMPIPCLLFWTGLTASLIDQYYLYPSYPRLIGGTILTFGTNIAIGGFGFCRWRADRFRLTKLTAFCLLIALGALILLQFGLMYLILNDTRTEYVIYMTYSMGPMMLCFYLNRHIMDNVSFEVFLRMKPSDKSYEGKKKFMKRLCGVLMLGAYCLTVAIHNAFAVGVQTKRSSSEGYHLAAGILFCDTIHSMHNFANLDTNPRLLMFQSFACRVLLYALWTDRWFIAMSVNFLLLAWLLVWHVIDQRNPRLTQEEAFERQVGSLEAMVEREKMRDLAGLPKEKKIDEKESKKAAMLAALGNNPAAQAAAAAAQAAQEAAELAYAALHSPEFSLLTCGSVYVLYVAVSFVGVQSPPPDWAASIFPNMQVGSDLYEQWKIGLVTLTLFIASAMLFFSMRYYENELWKMSGRVASVNAVFVVVTIVGAQLLGWTLHSDYIQLFGIYVPLIIVFTVYTYTQWRSKDYEFNGWQTVFSKRWDQNSRKWNKTDDGKAYLAYLQKIKDRINEEAARKEAIEKRELEDAEKDELTLLAEEKDPSLNPRPSAIPIDIPPPIPHPLGPRSGGDWGMWLLPAAKDFFRPWRSIPEGNQFVSDYLVAVGVALDVLSLLALSIHFGTYTDPEISALVAEFIAIFLLIIFFLIKWFNTYQISNGTTFIILVAACHSAYKMHKLGVAADIVVGYLALGSCAVLLIMAFSSWKASGYKITEYEGKVFFGSAIVIIFFTVLYMSTGSLQAGVVALMVLLVAYMLLYAAVYWANSDFVMPPKIKKVLYAVGVILVIIAAAAVSYLQLDWFYVITIIFVMFLIPTSINTGVGLYESPTFRIMPSRFIFPVFSYSPGLAQPKIKEDLTGTINLFMIAALCIVWGLAAGLLIQPAVVGWIVFCFGLIIAFGGLLDFYFDSAAKFWKNWEIVKDYETIVEDIRQKAIRLVQDQEEKPTSKKLKGKQAAAQPEADDDDEDPEGAPGDEPPEDPVALALWEAEQDIKRVQTLFRNTKRYWDWEQHADLDRTIMNRYKYKKNPTNYDGRWKGAFKFVKKRPNRELATKPYTPDELARIEASDQWFERAYIIEQYLYKLDCNINDKFAQQCKIQVMFQLLLSMTADAIAKKNRVRVKDFIRRLVETNMLHKSIENYSAPQVMSWGAKKDVQRMLKLQAEVYVDETIERMKKEGSQADADRMKAAARKNAVAGAAGGTAKASGEGAKIERSKLAIARDYTYIAPKAKIINDKNSPDNGLPEVCGIDPWYKMYVKKTQKDPSYKRSKPSDPEVRYIYPKGNKFIDDYQSLQIVGEKGETAESVTMKAREALKLFIAKWGENPKSAFIDIHFPDMINVDNMIENGADGDDTNTMPGTAAIWQRPKEFLKTKTNPFVFETDAIDPTCLLQGSIETCYLLSAVSVLAKKFPADRFKDMFITREFNEFGIYGMTLFDDGKWKAVWVDDQFLIKAKKGKPELVFARSKRPTELWVPLLEKCYAKLYRGYPLISGGLVHEAFKDFTGGATDEVDMRDPDAGVYDGRLWKKLLTYQKEGYLVGCGNPKPEGSHSENQGIIDGHAYSVLDIREAEGVKLLKLRNPWGDSEFTGDWSDVSSNWNARFRKLFDHFNDDPNDGVFWIGFEDFAVLFQKIYVCRLFDDVADVTNVDEATQKPIPPKPKPGQRAEDFSPYFRQIIDAEWKIADKTAAGSPAFLKDGYEPERNPQWTIELDSEAPPVMAFVSISQATQLDKKQYKNMALLALDRDGKRVRQLKKSQVVAGAVKFINNREISIEVPLTPGKKITIFPCTFKKDEETTFSLTIYCREAFKVEQLTSDTPFDD